MRISEQTHGEEDYTPLREAGRPFGSHTLSVENHMTRYPSYRYTDCFLDMPWKQGAELDIALPEQNGIRVGQVGRPGACLPDDPEVV